MPIRFRRYSNTENVEFRDPSRENVNIMYTVMTEIAGASDVASILHNLFGYSGDEGIDFVGLFENIESILDSTLTTEPLSNKATKDMLSHLGPYHRVPLCGLEDPCCICLDGFVKNEGYRVLTCKHVFHKKCIDKWFLDGSQECPMCRQNPWAIRQKENEDTG
jgi:hypothetical protein